jgi:hypothetical protein
MKNLLMWVIFPLLGLSVLACDKSEDLAVSDEARIEEIALSVEREEVSLGELPAEARTFVEENLFETFVEEAYRVRGLGYELRMGNGVVVYCNEEGRILQYLRAVLANGPFGGENPHGPCFDRVRRFGRPIRPLALPEAIRSYIATNYPDASIRRAKLNLNSYYVLISNPRPVVLEFSIDGNYLGEVDVLANCRFVCVPQPVGNLPESIATYVQTNFGAVEDMRACRRPNLVLVVFLHDDERVILGFDGDGNLLFQRP